MEITIKTKKDYHPESSKTLTILSASIVGIILVVVIGYCFYYWKNKPETVFFPVKNKKISILLRDSEGIKAETIQEKGKAARAKSVLKRLTQECVYKKLVDEKGAILPKAKERKFSETIKEALQKGEDAEAAIKTFIEAKKASKNDSLKKEEFNKLVHKTIKTPANQPKQPPTDEQIKAARTQLEENLKEVQTAWDEGKEGDTSYEELYVRCNLVSQYTRIKALVDKLVDKNKPQASKPTS